MSNSQSQQHTARVLSILPRPCRDSPRLSCRARLDRFLRTSPVKPAARDVRALKVRDFQTRRKMPKSTAALAAEQNLDALFAPRVPPRELRRAVRNCKACDLWETVTQTVFGEGSSSAAIMFVGEQPGGYERSKRPSVRGSGRQSLRSSIGGCRSRAFRSLRYKRS